MEERANRDSGAIQPAGDVALGRIVVGRRAPAAHLLTSNPPRRTAMLQAQPPHTPTSAAQAAVTRPTEAVIKPMGPGDAGRVLATPGPATSTGREPLAPALGDSKLVPQHKISASLHRDYRRDNPGSDSARDAQEDQLQAHKPKIIPSRIPR
jgi:hypothetical protein